MIQVKIRARSDGDFDYRCGRLINGLYWLAIGCAHRGPRDANAHATELDRSSARPLDPSSGAPLEAAQVSGRAESRTIGTPGK